MIMTVNGQDIEIYSEVELERESKAVVRRKSNDKNQMTKKSD